MAGVEKIKEKILLDAEERVKEIIESANKQAEDILNDAKEQANRRVLDISQKAAYDSSERRRIVNSMVELEMRKNVLAAKQEVIEKVFQSAIEKLSNMEASKYEEVLLDMILKAVKTGDEELVISQDSLEKLDKAFMDRLNERLITKGYKGNIKLSRDENSVFGGFIIRSSGVEINNSFESILRMNRDELEPKVAELLF